MGYEWSDTVRSYGSSNADPWFAVYRKLAAASLSTRERETMCRVGFTYRREKRAIVVSAGWVCPLKFFPLLPVPFSPDPIRLSQCLIVPYLFLYFLTFTTLFVITINGKCILDQCGYNTIYVVELF